MNTGEHLFSMNDASNLIRNSGLLPERDWLQFDCGLSCGPVECHKSLGMIGSHGWSHGRCIPQGGHQISFEFAARLGFGENQ